MSTSPAADIVWAARPGAQLSIVGADGEIVALRMTDDRLLIETPAQSSSLPVGGDVRIIVDGPILEVATQRGVYGAQVPASRGLTIVGDADAVRAYPLERACLRSVRARSRVTEIGRSHMTASAASAPVEIDGAHPVRSVFRLLGAIPPAGDPVRPDLPAQGLAAMAHARGDGARSSTSSSPAAR